MNNFLFRKEKQGNEIIITLLGFIKIKYKKGESVKTNNNNIEKWLNICLYKDPNYNKDILTLNQHIFILA